MAGTDTLGDAHAQRTLAGSDVPVFGQLRHTQGDGACCTAEVVFEIDRNPGVMVFPAHTESPPARLTTGARVGLPEQLLEETAVHAGAGRGVTAAAEFETGVPVRWRTELLPGLPLLAKPIVGRALLGVLEHLVGLASFLEIRFGIGLLASRPADTSWRAYDGHV